MISSIRRSVIFHLLSTVLGVALIAHVASADVVVLKDGTRHQGVVANRHLLEVQPGAFDVVSLLSGDDDLKRFQVSAIDYVVLEAESGDKVVDFSQLAQFDRRPIAHQFERDHSRKRQMGTLMVGFGAAALIVGTLVKFGGPKATVTDSRIDVDDDSYNAMNYALMIAGGILVVGGVFTLADTDDEDTDKKGGGMWDLEASLLEARLSVGYSKRF
jgi:hypothetical protein